MPKELKPCPGCGSKNIGHYSNGLFETIECKDCGAEASGLDPSVSAFWNRESEKNIHAHIADAIRATGGDDA